MVDELASQVAHKLQQVNRRIVLAESCTSGLIAARLGGIPGISQHLCGSFVVYRERSKVGWLGVDADLLASHTTESLHASSAIAAGALRNTEEADISLGITGHLGPDAPPEKDGLVFIIIWNRSNQTQPIRSVEKRLAAHNRVDRQEEAASEALRELLYCLGDL